SCGSFLRSSMLEGSGAQTGRTETIAAARLGHRQAIALVHAPAGGAFASAAATIEWRAAAGAGQAAQRQLVFCCVLGTDDSVRGPAQCLAVVTASRTRRISSTTAGASIASIVSGAARFGADSSIAFKHGSGSLRCLS